MQAETQYDTYESSGAGWKTFAGIMIIIVGTSTSSTDCGR